MQQEQDINTHLVWFRNDLRTIDNVVLNDACNKADRVIAVYCLDPRHYEISDYGFKKTEKYRAKFLLESLLDLKQELHKLNISLLVYQDQPEKIIPQLCNKYKVSTIQITREWTSEEQQVEQALRNKLPNTIEWNSHYNQFLYHPDDLNFEIAKTPQVFTAFRKKLEKYVDVRSCAMPKALTASNRIEDSTEIPSLPDLGFEDFTTSPESAFPFKGGETNAIQRIKSYFFETKQLGFYKKTRNGLLGVDYSSKLSAWLANGSLSPRFIYQQVKTFEKEHYKNQSTYWLIFELIWRDYFKYISMKHGNAIFKIDGILDKNYDWSRSFKLINKWIEGETSSDFVNANMIEIKKTGWMSNRGRQNVASYFSKELKLDWRIGAAYFEALLLDYDVHSNYGNWMYVSGVGNDPRDRKFNVERQAERYDTNGKYRRTWLQTELF